MRLGLGAFAPVGDGARDEDLPCGEPADFGDGSRPFVLAARFARFAFRRPVLARPLRRTPPVFLVAKPWRDGQVPNPKGDGTLGDAKASGDLVVVQSLGAQFAGLGAQGLALTAQGDRSLAQTIKLFFSSHTRILARAYDIQGFLRGGRRLAVAGGGGRRLFRFLCL